MSEYTFEMRLRLSKRFPAGVREVTFGGYELRCIPTTADDHGEAVLSFKSTYEHPEGGGSHPHEEARMVAHLLALCCDTRITPDGIRINDIDIPYPEGQDQKSYPQFFGEISTSELDICISRVQALDDDLSRQYIRAAKTYAFAISLIPSDITFAFFLLIVSIECMSSQEAVIPSSELHKDAMKCERFCRFIRENLPDECRGEDERDEKLFTSLLKTAYYSHRPGFAHGGSEVSIASMHADKANSSYFKHLLDGVEVKTPGIGWFTKIVRFSLIGFVLKQADGSSDRKRIGRLAYEKSGLTVKLRTDKEKYHVVTFGDVEYR